MKLEGLVQATLCFPLDKKGRVLLGRKTRVIGIGLYNAPGGGIETNESIVEATVREVTEEIGLHIRPEDIEPRAIVLCHNFKKDGVTPFDCRIFVSTANQYVGEPSEADGGLVKLQWFPTMHLPLQEMMVGDATWATEVFTGTPFFAEVWYAPHMQTLAQETRIQLCTKEDLLRSWHS